MLYYIFKWILRFFFNILATFLAPLMNVYKLNLYNIDISNF